MCMKVALPSCSTMFSVRLFHANFSELVSWTIISYHISAHNRLYAPGSHIMSTPLTIPSVIIVLRLIALYSNGKYAKCLILNHSSWNPEKTMQRCIFLYFSVIAIISMTIGLHSLRMSEGGCFCGRKWGLQPYLSRSNNGLPRRRNISLWYRTTNTIGVHCGLVRRQKFPCILSRICWLCIAGRSL